MTVRALRAELREIEARAAPVRAALAEAKRRKLVRCSACGRASRVGGLTYIQTHFYITPHGCTGGDYWKEGEGQFDCPKCGTRNRLFGRPDVAALKCYFKAITKEHDH